MTTVTSININHLRFNAAAQCIAVEITINGKPKVTRGTPEEVGKVLKEAHELQRKMYQELP